MSEVIPKHRNTQLGGKGFFYIFDAIYIPFVGFTL